MAVTQNLIYFVFYDLGLTLNIKFRILCCAYKSCNNKLVLRRKSKLFCQIKYENFAKLKTQNIQNE